RKEKPHPGAQLRITDVNGWRVTAFATNTPAAGGSHRSCAHLELRHRRRARCEDRIRIAKDTGLTNLPLHDFDQNRIWLAVVALAVDLTAWWQMLALAGHPARRWEPKRLRLRLFSIAGRLADHGRTRRLHLAASAPWAWLLLAGLDRLRALPAPTRPSTDPPRRPSTTDRPVDPATTPTSAGPPSHPEAESARKRRLHRRLEPDRATHERSGLVA